MLKAIDILLGLSVVMLIVSMAVTVLTQFVTGLFNSHGRHLRRGLVELLEHIDPNLQQSAAKKIATAILTHPLIQDWGGRRLGSTIHREEFINLLMELAAHAGPQGLQPAWRDVLVRALENNGIAEPGTTLDNVRSLALHLELAHPELATTTRHAMALMHEANSKLVAKVNAAFDQTIDRVSQRFTFVTRIITFGCALVVAVGLQVDAVGLINRLATDPSLRNALVQQALRLDQQAGQSDQTSQSKSSATPARTLIPMLTDRDKQNFQALQTLVGQDLLSWPTGSQDWYQRWQGVNIFGVLLSAILLSLGAPFWYNALKNLLRLRSLIATKDDEERQVRATTQVAPSPQASAAPGTTA